ncbi:MAG: ATP-binding protein [Pseudolysinimonas sp.]|uniref:ATP-binding protein n=1 Tax=Pseudolysinimonas sp. TaxID=2680009 RepID=UPI003C7533E0
METSQGDLDLIVKRIRAAGTDLARVEVKAAAGGLPTTIWETISSFSNGRGGLIILGLDERTGFRPAVGFDATAIRDAVSDGFRPRRASDPDGPLTPRPQGTIDVGVVDGSPVVVVEVEELPAEQKPSFVTTRGKENGSFERTSDGDRRMSTHAIFLLATASAQPTDDRHPVDGAGYEDLDASLIERFVRRLRRVRPRAVADLRDDREILVRFGVLDADRNSPTLAGLLAFGRYPQQYFPQLMISFAAYPGRDKAVVAGDVRMLDRRIIDGPIPAMVDDAVSALLQNLKTRRVSRGAGAVDEPEIPVDALREAVVNALSHRDYSAYALGEQVRIEVYPDRVEIHNPGGIYGGRGEIDLYDGSSRSRNATLSSLLPEVPFPDRDETISENAGSGIPRMTGVLGQAGLTAPRFRSTVTSMSVTLDRHGILTPEVDAWLDGIGARELTRHGRIALALVRHGFDVHDQLLRSQLGIDTEEAKQVLRELVSQGWLSYPRRPGDAYRVGAILARGIIDSQPPLVDLPFEQPRPAGHDSMSLDERVLAWLEILGESDIHELAILAESTPGSLRPRLRVLVDQGAIDPTAAPQSRNRRYLLRRSSDLG